MECHLMKNPIRLALLAAVTLSGTVYGAMINWTQMAAGTYRWNNASR